MGTGYTKDDKYIAVHIPNSNMKMYVKTKS